MGAWNPSLDGDLDPVTGVWWVGPVCVWGTSEACVSGYPARLVDPRIAAVSVRLAYSLAP